MKIKTLFTLALLLFALGVSAQKVRKADILVINNRLELSDFSVYEILDTIVGSVSDSSLLTAKAVKDYVDANAGGGGGSGDVSFTDSLTIFVTPTQLSDSLSPLNTSIATNAADIATKTGASLVLGGTRQLIVLFGQSNADGRGATSEASAEETDPDGRIQIWTGSDFEALDIDGDNHGGTGGSMGSQHGIELGLLAHMDKFYADGDTIYLVKQAIGGTQAVTWLPNGSNGSSLKTEINQAIDSIEASGYVPNMHFVYMQGEANGGNTDSTAVFPERLNSIINDWRDTLNKVVPFTFTTLFRRNSNYIEINTDFFNAADSSDLVYVIPTQGYPSDDSLHWNYTALKQIALDVHRTMKINNFYGSLYRDDGVLKVVPPTGSGASQIENLTTTATANEIYYSNGLNPDSKAEFYFNPSSNRLFLPDNGDINFSLSSDNRTVRIEGDGIYFGRASNGAEVARILNASTGGDSDVEFRSNTRFDFLISGNTKLTVDGGGVVFPNDVVEIGDGGSPCRLHSYGNEDLYIRAGDSLSTRNGELYFQTKDQTRFTIENNGGLIAHTYGTAANSGTVATYAAFTSTGGVIEVRETDGVQSASTDGSGDLTVTHGLGTTPGTVIATAQGTTPYICTVHTIGATTFKIRVSDTAGAAVTSTAVDVHWVAKE